MKRFYPIILAAAAMLPQTIRAQWTDVTKQMIINPTFENNSREGWSLWCYGACNVSYEALESFNGWFDFSQQISAPAGQYRLSCNAYYRAGSNYDAYNYYKQGTELPMWALLYAGDNSTRIPAVYDYYRTDQPTWWGGWYEAETNGEVRQYPDNMQNGEMMFSEGDYRTTLTFTHDGGALTFGVRSNSEDVYGTQTNYASDWCMMDNFKLEYYGTMPKIPVEYFYCYDETLDLIKDDNYTLKTYVYPANATERNNIKWTSSNTAVATVDANGVVTAKGNGTATITGNCDGEKVYITIAVTTIDETGKTWVDVTSDYLSNTTMEDGFDAWNRIPARVDYDMAEFWNVSFDFYQEVELPEGDYRFSCEGFFRPTSSPQDAIDYYGTTTNVAYIYGGTRKVPMLEICSERITDNSSNLLSMVYDSKASELIYLPNSMEAAKWCFENGYYNYSSVTFHSSGTDKMRLGLMCADWSNGQWAIFDNFRLERLLSLVATQSLTFTTPKTSLVPGETMQAALTITPQNATYQTANWTSNNESILTVDANGLITAVGVGTATITARAKDNDNVKKSQLISVKEEVVTNGSLIINEVMSMNVDRFLDPSFNYGGWIELYNPTTKAVSLRGCHITEDPANMTQYNLVNAGVVPAKGYYTIWFDHCNPYYPTQVDCKLSTSGDWIAVTSANGDVLAEIEYPAGVQRCSWARKTDGGEEWGFTADATPGATNNNSKWATTQLAAPTVDVQGQLFESAFTVKATWPAGSTLRYTTDGSTPSATNGSTSTDGVFSIDATTNLRLIALQDGMLPSAVTTNTYIYKDYDFTIPVLSITADYEDIWGNDHGILVKGSGNGRPGNGQSSKCNWNQDWDHPCTFEYYMPSGERTFMQDVDICAAGGWSRAWEPHSFKLKAAKVYGINSMDYPFFESKPYNKHKALQIRNGGNDNGCRFKDAAIQTIIQTSGLYVDGQAYQPVVHYINGRYMGVINMREPNNKHHAYSNYGYDTDLLDQFEISPDSGYVQKEGSIESLMDWYELAKDAADPDVYKQICDECVDIDEYANYMAVWTWLANSDWMRNNVKGYRSTETGGKYHFVIFDTDGSFGGSVFSSIESMGTRNWSGDYIYEQGRNLSFELYPATIWVNMLQSDTFRKHFVDAFSIVCGSVFEPKRCNTIADELYNRVQPMMQLTGESATSTYNSIKSNMGSSKRNNNMLQALKDYYKFYEETADPINVTFSSNIPEAGILYNNHDVPTGKFTGTVFLPVTLTASAPAGYDFKGWMLKGGTSTSTETIFAQGEDWEYYDQGSLDGESWMTTNYSADWFSGTAPLGYDDGSSEQGVSSLLNTNTLEKGLTFYFRKEFSLANAPKDGETYSLNYILDDGCVAYINGSEAARNNMPSGIVGYDTRASSYASGNPNRGSMTIPANLLKKGRNVIAVEVHNNNPTSSDICWDCSLTVSKSGEVVEGDIISTDTELSLYDVEGGAELIAYYEPKADATDPTKVAPVCINEVSAANETFANEYFKRNDWLELYNNTDEDIDIAGYYLTDNINKPQKWQVPTQLESGAATIIPAHGYMMIWCDKLTPISQQHASFKLSADDSSYVMLTAADGSWFDYLVYPALDRDHTAGRYPDGSDDVFVMTTMTPAKANQLSSYTEQYTFTDLPTAIRQTEVSDAADLTIAFDGQQVVTNQTARIELYTTSGELLITVPRTKAMGVSTLRSGVYVARAKVGDKVAVVKFTL